jgi:hypothetical protein
MSTETVTVDWPSFTFTPTEEELEAERRYWADLDRIAEYDAWVQMQAEEQEHAFSYDCDCPECRATADEYREMDREYERTTRGF